MTENRTDEKERLQFLVNEVLRLRRLANTDKLTGMFDRGYFNHFISDVVEVSKTENIHCGLIMFDIDHFKEINDTYGHTAGDKVLEQISDLVRGIVREDDVLARYGGEEFGVILVNGSEISEDRLVEIAEIIRNEVSELIFTAKNKEFNVTVSLGVGNYNHGESDVDFINRIDSALYRAKDNGRNQVVVAQSV